MTDTYTLAMNEGHASLGLGQHARACSAFTRASETARDNAAYVSAIQMRGVVNRLMGRYGTAHQDFEDALHFTLPDSVQAGRIMRDQGLCYLDQARGDVALAVRARTSFEKSLDILRHRDVAEAATTISCLGEYYIFIEDRQKGVQELRRAVRLVRGKHAVYEMNNRVRLARASALWRWIGAPLTLVVGVRTKKNVAKLVEFTLLLIGGTRLAGAGRRGLANFQLVRTRR